MIAIASNTTYILTLFQYTPHLRPYPNWSIISFANHQESKFWSEGLALAPPFTRRLGALFPL